MVGGQTAIARLLVSAITRGWAPIPQAGKKLTRWHWQNFEPEKFAYKICAKKAQNHAKMPKMHTKIKTLKTT